MRTSEPTYGIKKKADMKNVKEPPGWAKADGRGAGYGMIAWSGSAFLGPVSIAGFIYGAVSSAVFSSLDAL